MQCRTAEVLAIIFQLEGYSIFLGKLVKTHLGLFLKEYRSRLLKCMRKVSSQFSCSLS